MRIKRDSLSHLSTAVENLQAEIAALRAAALETENVSSAVEDTRKERKRLARGSETTTAPEPTLPERIEVALRASVCTIGTLVASTGEKGEEVAKSLADLIQSGKVYRLGTEELPRYTWVIGDDTDVPTLQRHVETLISDRPMTFPELLAATKARRGRVSGAIVALQRDGQRILNLGTDRRALWFIPQEPEVILKRVKRLTAPAE